ncbi:hypothetical protein ACFUIY_12825 [Streptomyces griseorubiginosus]|uniref:hypothetical protein n=1 Tax=Streptomyces griseorubiginosus TaxID=67304 RepID=UPI0036290067
MNARTAALSITALAAISLLMTGCSDSSGSATSAPTSAAPAPTFSETPAYTAEDCKDLLEKNYTEDNVHDASDEAQCLSLSNDEYVAAVGDVLADHKDDILTSAANEVVYDAAWDSVDPDTQQLICDTMTEEGTEPVAGLLDITVEDPTVDTSEMAQYLFDTKC